MTLHPAPSGVSRTPGAAKLIATLHKALECERLERTPTGLRLVVIEGPDSGRSYTLDGLVVSGGRGPGQDVRLEDARVSDAHFELRVTGEGIMLRDVSSTNGTWVGRARLAGPVELFEGSTFFAGNDRIRIDKVLEGTVAVTTEDRLGTMCGTSRSMRKLFSVLQRLAPTTLEVLVGGETGTGKEEVANTLHALSGRTGKLVVVNSGALPADLVESILFGHKRGSFTGATSDAAGCFEAADGGTLFLDEIGELRLDLQPKLLRAIDKQEVTRLGENVARKVDVRLLSATHRNLPELVARGEFREDLFHRIATMRVEVPPLRERPGDIRLLATHFLDQHAHDTGCRLALSDDAVADLEQLHWEGNVRQLKAVIRRTAFLAGTSTITGADLRRFGTEWSNVGDEPGTSRLSLPLKQATDKVVEAFQLAYCRELLDEVDQDIGAAAERAGYSRRRFRDLLARLSLLEPEQP